MKNNIFIKNTLSLYLLKISNYLFSFITVPLQTRVLGPELYGSLGFALAFSMYFQNFIDFGFTLSGIEKISKNKDDREYVSKVHSNIFYSRVILSILSFIIFILLILYLDIFKSNYIIYILYYFSAVVLAFMPDYLYMGIQKMEALMYRSVLSRFIFSILLFIVLREKSQINLVPLFSLIGNIIAIIFVYVHVNYKLKYKIINTSFNDIFNEIKYAFSFFVSRLAQTLYSTANTFALGIFYGTSSLELGLYKPADQSIYIAKQSFFPLIDSLYPYMSNKKDYRFYKKILFFGIFIILFFTIIVDIFAYDICSMVFGIEFYNVGKYLRLLSPSVLLAFLTMMFGYPLLSPLGLTKYANYSNIFSSLVHILVLIIFSFFNVLTIENICILISFTELISFLFRLLVLCFKRR